MIYFINSDINVIPVASTKSTLFFYYLSSVGVEIYANTMQQILAESLITLNNKIVSVIQKQPIVRALWNFINNTRNTVRFPIRIPYNYGRILHHFRDNARYSSTINTFCRTQSVQCNFFTFDHVTFIQFKICSAAVYKISSNRMIFR